MTCYIVTFEVTSDETREKLRERLKSYGYFCPILNNCWAIMTEKKAADVRDDLTKLVGPNGRLFVIRSGTEAAWYNSYGTTHDEWLKRNL